MVALRSIDEPAAAGGDERVEYVEQGAGKENGEGCFRPCGHLFFGARSELKTRLCGGGGGR